MIVATPRQLHATCLALGGHGPFVDQDSCSRCGLHGMVIRALDREDDEVPTEREPRGEVA